jgi:hypothetical protein
MYSPNCMQRKDIPVQRTTNKVNKHSLQFNGDFTAEIPMYMESIFTYLIKHHAVKVSGGVEV